MAACGELAYEFVCTVCVLEKTISGSRPNTHTHFPAASSPSSPSSAARQINSTTSRMYHRTLQIFANCSHPILICAAWCESLHTFPSKCDRYPFDRNHYDNRVFGLSIRNMCPYTCRRDMVVYIMFTCVHLSLSLFLYSYICTRNKMGCTKNTHNTNYSADFEARI